jgi:hypothetical protein
MRLLLIPLLLVAALGGHAADDAPAKGVHAINTVCPVDGRKIDPKLAPVRVVLEGDHEIWVGICSEDDRRKIVAEPKAYGKAAIANKKAEAGK